MNSNIFAKAHQIVKSCDAAYIGAMDEKQLVLGTYNNSEYMKRILIQRAYDNRAVIFNVYDKS